MVLNSSEKGREKKRRGERERKWRKRERKNEVRRRGEGKLIKFVKLMKTKTAIKYGKSPYKSDQPPTSYYDEID